jgi:hypothetical protein
MLALSVSVNDEPLCTAGAPIDGVLGVHVAWVDVSRWSHGRLLFWVGGLDSIAQEHLRWAAPRLEVGDRVSIRVVDADTTDPPAERESADWHPYSGR